MLPAPRLSRAKGGRPPYSTLLMVKILVLQQLYNLADDALGEILERVDEPNGSTLQSFMWESLSKKDDVYLPNLILEFSTGHGKPGAPVNSSMSDAEALALWEKISASLRRRPVQSVTPVSAAERGI